MSLSVLASTFALIAIAELPDKTMVANVIMGARGRAGWVWVGSSAAFALHVAIAVAAGRVLMLAPHRAVQIVVTILFGAGAAYLLFVPERSEEAIGEREAERESGALTRGARSVAVSAFAVVAIGEFGDLTQVLTANMAARSHSSLSVGVGALGALWAVSAIGAFGGRSLLTIVPLAWIRRIGGGVLVGFCIAGIVGLV